VDGEPDDDGRDRRGDVDGPRSELKSHARGRVAQRLVRRRLETQLNTTRSG
jgi:hypothetical protein